MMIGFRSIETFESCARYLVDSGFIYLKDFEVYFMSHEKVKSDDPYTIRLTSEDSLKHLSFILLKFK